MIDYLRETMGFSAEETVWKDEATLPRFLRGKRRYSILTIQNTQLLLIHVKEEDFNLQIYLKQMEKLKVYWPGEMVLAFDKLSTYQRKTLIAQRLPFIIPGGQIYIPRLGILLQEEQAKSVAIKKEHFSAGSQFVFLYMLCHAEKFPMNKTELAHDLGTNAMAITRAVQELKQLELVHCNQVGRSDYVSPAYSGKELWQNGVPFLINPVRKKVYVRNHHMLRSQPISGEEALAEVSMLAKPTISVRAMNRNDYKHAEQLVQIDPAWDLTNDYIELEIWAYDPCLLAREGHVDPFSLYASLKENMDERIEEALEEMLEGYKW